MKTMKTIDLAAQLAELATDNTDMSTRQQRYLVDEIYRRLLLFLTEHKNGSGPTDPERKKARLLADMSNRFWLPCVLCSRWYSGSEVGGCVMLNGHQGVCICNDPECVAEAKRLNEANGPAGLGMIEEKEATRDDAKRNDDNSGANGEAVSPG